MNRVVAVWLCIQRDSPQPARRLMDACRAINEVVFAFPLSAGVFGSYSRIANEFVTASDCLLVIGCKLGEIATRRFALIPPGKPLIHVDVLPEEIGRTTRADIALTGDAR